MMLPKPLYSWKSVQWLLNEIETIKNIHIVSNENKSVGTSYELY